MTKPGIFFEGVDIYGLPDKDSYWNTAVRDICRAMDDWGVPCAPLNLQDEDNTTLSFDTSALPPFAISWNFNNGRWVIHKGQQVRMTSILPVKNIALLWDHPFHWIETIDEMCNIDRQTGRQPCHVGVMDDGHITYLREAGMPLEQIFCWKQAGPTPTGLQPPPQIDRDIGAVFHGTINDVESFRDFCARIRISDPIIMRLLENCIAAVIEETIDVHAAVIRHVVDPAGMDPAPLATAPLCREIDRLTRDIRRVALLGGLRDLEIHFIGKVDPAFQAANPKGVFPGPLSFGKIIRYLQRCRTVLYDTINFRDAAVMRLFYSIQEGCVPAAELNKYLEQEFTDGSNILALNLQDPQGNLARLHDVIATPTVAQALSDSARHTCAARHTWTNRIGPLVNAIQG